MILFDGTITELPLTEQGLPKTANYKKIIHAIQPNVNGFTAIMNKPRAPRQPSSFCKLPQVQVEPQRGFQDAGGWNSDGSIQQ
jgi:hypothetical protein